MFPNHRFNQALTPRFRHLVSILIMVTLICFGPVLFPASGVPFQNFAAVSAASDPVIAAAGDIACDPTNANFKNGNGSSNACRQKYTSDLLVNAGLAAVLDLGDNQYYCGGYQAFVQSYDLSWGRVKSITHPAVGNHEYLTSGGTDCNAANAGAAGYFQYFGAAAGEVGKGYYSFDIGTWHLIALNSNCGDAGGCSSNSPQGKWLEADLTAHTNFCTLAFWHIPLYSSGGRAASNTQSFWNALYNHNADLILTGHDHIYERFAPQTPGAVVDNVRGIREFIVGTGGADHTTITTIAANSEVRNASTYGVMKLTLHPTSYDWSFVPEAGKTFTDSGTTACHDISTLPSPTPTSTRTPTITRTPTSTRTPTITRTPTGGPTATFTPTSTPTDGPTATFTPTSTPTDGPTATFTPTPTDGPTATFTPTPTDGPTATFTPTPTDGPTATFTETSTPTTGPTATFTPTPTPTTGPTATFTPTSTPTSGPTATLTPSGGSILFSDGFESGNLANWTTVSGLVVQNLEVDTGSFAARETGTGFGATYARKTLSAPQTDLYYRIDFKLISQGANTVTLLKFRTAADVSILGVSINSSGRLIYLDDITGISVSSSVVVSQGAWQSLQVHVHIADTASQIQVWYNNVLVSALSRTDSFGTNPVGRVQLGENTSGRNYDVAIDNVTVSTGFIN